VDEVDTRGRLVSVMLARGNAGVVWLLVLFS